MGTSGDKIIKPLLKVLEKEQVLDWFCRTSRFRLNHQQLFYL